MGLKEDGVIDILLTRHDYSPEEDKRYMGDLYRKLNKITLLRKTYITLTKCTSPPCVFLYVISVEGTPLTSTLKIILQYLE